MKWTDGLSKPGVLAALGAALLFGAGTPLAKLLLHSVSPWLLAGLLYLGAGLGMAFKVRLDAMQLHRPRQWGACWLACHLYEQLELDRFWQARLPDSREGTRWRHILQTLVVYRFRSWQRMAFAPAVV